MSIRDLITFGLGPSTGGGTYPTASEIADAVWDEARSGHTTDGTYGDTAEWSGTGPSSQTIRDAMKLAPTSGAPATGSIDKHLDDILSYGGGSGTGTYTDTVTDGVNPLDGVRVQLSTDSAGSNRVYEAYTNALGVFTMNPDPGTYYSWFDLAGYTFTNGTQVIVT